MDSIFSLVGLIIVGGFMCLVPFVFITSIFSKDNNPDKAEPWMLIVAGIITLALFFIGFGDHIQWHRIF